MNSAILLHGIVRAQRKQAAAAMPSIAATPALGTGVNVGKSINVSPAGALGASIGKQFSTTKKRAARSNLLAAVARTGPGQAVRHGLRLGSKLTAGLDQVKVQDQRMARGVMSDANQRAAIAAPAMGQLSPEARQRAVTAVTAPTTVHQRGNSQSFTPTPIGYPGAPSGSVGGGVAKQINATR